MCLQAVSSFRPDVFVDTTGWAFGYPIARAAGCRVVSYVHYPTVSSEMVARVSRRHIAFNNSAQLARSSALTMAKVAYYRALSHVYALCGRMSHWWVCGCL